VNTALPSAANPDITPEATGEPLDALNRPAVRWLRFRCNDQQLYALELLKVQEVVRPAPLLSLRGTSSAMLGVMNLRGQVVPLLDLGQYLHNDPIAHAPQTHPDTRIVVLEEHGEVMGLLVAAVDDVTSLHPEEIEPPEHARPGGSNDGLFCGIARHDLQTLILLNASVLLQAS